MKLIRNVRVISPDIDYKYANIIIDGEYIKSVTEKEVNPENFDDIIEGEGLIAYPGFIDEHTHGAVGYDVCDGRPESVDKIAEARLKEGVTMFLPTTLTQPNDVLVKAAEAVAEYRRNERWAETPGMHIEGPYINCAYKGAQNPEYIRLPDTEEIRQLNAIAPVKIVTVAPEVEGRHLRRAFRGDICRFHSGQSSRTDAPDAFLQPNVAAAPPGDRIGGCRICGQRREDRTDLR